MAEYRLLADSMWVGDNKDRRAHRGDMVEVDDERAPRLLDAGAIVKKGEETDAQKKEFDKFDSAAEAKEANVKEIKEQEAALAKLGGEKDNKTQAPKPTQPAGAPNTAPASK